MKTKHTRAILFSFLLLPALALVAKAQDPGPAPEIQPGSVDPSAAINPAEKEEADSLAPKRRINVIDLSTERIIYEFLPATFSVTIRNSGEVPVAPKGNIFIDHGDQHDLAIINIVSSRDYIASGSAKTFSASWKDESSPDGKKIGHGKAELEKNANGTKFLQTNLRKLDARRWGKYTANLLLVYNDGTRDIPLERNVEFWIVPWKLVALLVAILICLLLGIYFSLKKFNDTFEISIRKSKKNDK